MQKRCQEKGSAEGREMHFQGTESTRGDPKPQNLFIKKLCIYSYMFKLQSPSKYSPSDAIHLLRIFPTAQNNF